MSATLVSMTGHGDALVPNDDVSVSVELRAVNHRHFKLVSRGAEVTPAQESRIESLLRATVHRGCVNMSLKLQRSASDGRFQFRLPVLRSYYNQLVAEFGQQHIQAPAIAALVTLPGVVEDATRAGEICEADWPLVEEGIRLALDRLQAMRLAEGQSMAQDLRKNCQELREEVDRLATRAPLVVDSYRRRIQDRVGRVLADQNVTLAPADVVREVAIFADRCDISEELVRLRSHIDQFLTAMQAKGATGRRLDFITQEMFREANTIGSKANDVEIARCVVELKNRIEKMREMVQNIE